MSYVDLTPETGTELTNGGKVGFVDCTAEGAAGTKLDAKWLSNLKFELEELIERAGATSTVEFNPANSETYRDVYNAVMALSRNYIATVDYSEGDTVIIGTELFVRNSNTDSSLEVGWDGGYSLVSGTVSDKQIGLINQTGIELTNGNEVSVFSATYSAKTNNESVISVNTSVSNVTCKNNGDSNGNISFGLILKVTVTNSDATTAITRKVIQPIGQVGGFAEVGEFAAIASIFGRNSLSTDWSGADVFHGTAMSSGIGNIKKGDVLEIEIVARSDAAVGDSLIGLQTGIVNVVETEQ